jgi:pheromone shutdown protein TraB
MPKLTISEKAKLFLTLSQELDKLNAESEAITQKQRDVHKAFVVEMKRLSKHHETVLNKRIAVEQTLGRCQYV